MSYKPDGYPDLSPYLLVEDVEAEVAFIVTVLGGTQLRMIPDETGAITHGEARIGDSVVMLGRMPEGETAHVHFYTPDADALHARAVAAGCTVLQEMMEKGNGDRRGGVLSPGDTGWWFSRQLEESA